MSDEHENEYGPNPELYAKLAERYESKEEADFALKGFLLAVKKLREEFRVPEVMVHGACHFKPENEGKKAVTIRAAGFGAPEFRAQLGALAFNTYTLPEIERAEQLRALATATPPKVKKGKR